MAAVLLLALLGLYSLTGTKVLCSGKAKIFDFQQQKFRTVASSFGFKETNPRGFNLSLVYATAINVAHSSHTETASGCSRARHVSGFHILSFYHSFPIISYHSHLHVADGHDGVQCRL